LHREGGWGEVMERIRFKMLFLGFQNHAGKIVLKDRIGINFY
jgi:hypothetical protein